MKIGILTYHFAINYGAVLQCYALQQYLKSLGHDVEVINFIPQNYSRKRFWQNNNLRNDFVNGMRKMFLKLKYSSGMRKSFSGFASSRLNLSESVDYTNFSDALNKYEAVITGSDQVWGPSRWDDLCYFFDNMHNYRGRKISYAPCCAINRAKNILKRNEIAALLSEFYSLSVRNMETYNFVFDLIGKNVPIVSDPTLLYEFNELTDGVQPVVTGKYILAYILGADINGGNDEAIEIIKKQTGIEKVVAIVLTENAPKVLDWATKTFYSASLIEWLVLFKNASFVYTDSFHGVMFSLKYNRPFVTYYKEKDRASRFLDLEQRFGLENVVTNLEELKSCLMNGLHALSYIDRMQDNIKESKLFLQKSLS